MTFKLHFLVRNGSKISSYPERIAWLLQKDYAYMLETANTLRPLSDFIIAAADLQPVV